MKNFTNQALKSLTAAMRNTDMVKATFTMFTKKGEQGWLCSVRLTTKTDQLSVAFVTATDEEAASPISFTVDGKKFCDVADTLAEFGKDVAWDIQDSQLILSVESVADVKIPIEAEAAEEISFSNEGAVGIVVAGKDFTSLLRRGGAAADAKASGKVANVGVILTTAEKKLEVFSANAAGSMLAYAKCSIQQMQAKEPKESYMIGIPAASFEKILRITSGQQATRLMFTESQVIVGAGTMMYVSSLGGECLNFSAVQKQWGLDTEASVTVDNEQLQNAIKVLEVTEAIDKPAAVTNPEGFLVLEAGTDKVQTASNASAGQLDPYKEEIALGLDPKLLLKAVKSLNRGNVTIRTNNTKIYAYILTNGTVTDTEVNAAIYVLKMPMKK